MKLILIRHGETRESRKGVLLGSLSGNLTTKGKREVLKTAKKIKKLNPEIIFSSDLKRTKDSAIIIAKKLKLKIKYDKLLRERSGGIAEGKKENEINWKEYEKIAISHRKHKGGESFLDVKKRAIKFIKNLRFEKYKTVIIVSHSVVLAMMLSHIKHWGIKKSLSTDFKKLIFIKI